MSGKSLRDLAEHVEEQPAAVQHVVLDDAGDALLAVGRRALAALARQLERLADDALARRARVMTRMSVARVGGRARRCREYRPSVFSRMITMSTVVGRPHLRELTRQMPCLMPGRQRTGRMFA